MYLNYYGFQKTPFQITPDTGLFFNGSDRGTILEALLYAVESGYSVIKIVGEVGTGKTMLCHMLANCLNTNIDIVYIANPNLCAKDILQTIALDLNIPIPSDWSKAQVVQALTDILLKKHAQNRQVVVFVEEAQMMPLGTLEEIRLLSNLETGDSKLLQVVLFGQPELDATLSKKEIRQFRERITYSFYLSPFKTQDITQYIEYRLRNAGFQGPNPFSRSAIKAIARYSSGLARRINILSDKSLLIAFIANRHQVKKQDVLTALRDSEFRERKAWKKLATPILLLALILLGTTLAITIPPFKTTLSPLSNHFKAPLSLSDLTTQQENHPVALKEDSL